ncbi:apolipoprotein N-acyltransferase [Calditerrivibrio nitroreducens]|nr:apolipoprotein N-acyltransferase [Calditerrivibrio nitroreducens]
MMDKLKMYLLAVISAFLLTISGPGFGYSLLVYIALVPVIYGVYRYKERWFSISVTFSMLYNIVVFYWVTETVNYFGDVNIAVRVVLLIMLAGYLSIFWVLFFRIVVKVNNVFIISMVFAVIELIKGFLFTGFPWMNLGLNSLGYRPLALNAAYVGEIGVSFIIILSNILLVSIIMGYKRYLIYFIGLIIISHLAYFSLKEDYRRFEKIDVAIVQPSYNYLKKWDPNERSNVVREVLQIADEAMKEGSSLVVLPESSFPLYIQDDERIINYFKSYSYYKGIIVGNIRYQKKDERVEVYNSNFYFNDGEIDYYDKIHLVPFGEYFPMKFITAPIQRYFFGGNNDFSEGKESKIFQFREKKIGNLICFEDAFYRRMIENVRKGAEIVVVTTNDSWFGKSLGRYQHFAISMMRSIEAGRGIIRSSQSGISACIAPYGNVTAMKMINEKGVLSCDGYINKNNTIFSIIGYWWLVFLLSIAIVIEILYRNKRR